MFEIKFGKNSDVTSNIFTRLLSEGKCFTAVWLLQSWQTGYFSFFRISTNNIGEFLKVP